MSGELYEVYGKIQYSPKAQCPDELYGTTVKLKSKDGDNFELEAEAACMSKVIKKVILADGVDEVVSIPMKKATVGKLVEYMKYHVTNPFGAIRTPLESENLVECGATKWDNGFVSVDKDMLMELAIAASILDIPSLFFLTGAKLAVMTKDKPADKLIKDFTLALDMQPDEEEQVKQKVQEAMKAKWGEGYDDSLTAIACILSSMSIAAERLGVSTPEGGVPSGVKSYRKSGWRAAVFQSWTLLQEAPVEVKADRELIAGVLAVSAGAALGYAADALRADRALVLEAVKYNGANLKDADPSLQSDRDFVRQAVAINGAALGGASEGLRADRDFLLELAHDGLGAAMQGAPDALCSDRDFVLDITAEDPVAFKYASDDLKNDRQFALEVVQKSGKALQYLPAAFKADKEIVLAAVASHPDAILYVHTSRRAELGLTLPHDSEKYQKEEADQQHEAGVEGGTKFTSEPMWTGLSKQDYGSIRCVKMQKMLYFSGMGTITPNIGQVNYLAANSLHDRLPIYNKPELDVVTLLQGAVGGTVGMRWKAFASADQLANASPESMLGIMDECKILEMLSTRWDVPECVAGAFIDEQSRQWILMPQAGVIQGPPWGRETIAPPVQRASVKVPEPVQQPTKPAPEAGPLGGWPSLLQSGVANSAPPMKEKEMEPFEGARVQLVGLAAGNKLNFKEGSVLKQFKDGKWKVRMDEKKLGHVLVTSDRLRVLPSETLLADVDSNEATSAAVAEAEAAHQVAAEREAAAATEHEAAVAAAREAAERRRERVAEKRQLVKEKILNKRASQVPEACEAEDSDDEPPPLEDREAEDEAMMLAGATAPFTAPFAGPRF
mmetsp:Transcript_48124/g.111438  ORF Transcript_48124/g.111438 Transcript_48124/m.111438 type:complete len:841 (+) Transcript_48124:80-2602(+)